MNKKTVKDILDLIKKEGVEIADFRFMDFPGLWQHFSIPAREVSEDTFENGLGFDGSSIRGWQAINESDMLVKPVPETAFIGWPRAGAQDGRSRGHSSQSSNIALPA